MKKIIKQSVFVLCLLFLILPLTIKADGMILPPPNYYINETDQKAVIFYDKGIESLILSITFKGNADDFGWVVPVPTKPDVSKGSDDIFSNLETLTGTTSRYYDEIHVFGLGSSGTPKKVTIIETKKIDYYDVTVLTSTESNALTKWLQDNNYNFPASASYILESYIQNNWYFVAMKINPQSLGWTNVSQQLREGHATPVVLKFKTKNIVYPLKISSVVSGLPTTYYNNDESNNDNSNIINVPHTPTYAIDSFGKGVTIGSIGMLSFPADTAFPTSAGTIEFFINPYSDWETSGNGYWELVNVVDSNGKDIFELRREKSTTYDNIQLVGYNSSFSSIWKTSDEQQLTWDSAQTYHIAATWSETSNPKIYINGVLQDTEASFSGTSWSLTPSVEGATMYFGQRRSQLGSSPLRGTFHEIRISSNVKTAKEIATSYQQSYDNKSFGVEENTKFLAHLNGDLTEEISGNKLTYTELQKVDTEEKINIPYTDETSLNPTYVDGKTGQGISIASNDVYTFGADNTFNTEEGTIEMWVKPGNDWSSSSSVYWTLFSVVDNQGRDVFEFKRMKNDTHDNLQFTTYNPPNTKANTKAGLEQLDQDWEIVGFSICNTTNKLAWNYDQWYHIAVTWLKSESPQIYINGVAQTSDRCTVDMSSVAGGKIYIGQLGEELGANSVRAVVDEVRITSKQKTADEVKTAYNQVLSNKQLDLENNTLLLAHFNSNLKEEKSGKEIDYKNINYNNTTSNNKATFTDGKINQGVKIGEDDYLILSSTDFFPNKTGTASAWFKPQWLEERGYFQFLTIYDSNSNEVFYFRIARDYGTGLYYLQLISYYSGDADKNELNRQYVWGSEEVKIIRNDWQQAAVTWKEGEKPIFYFNGQLAGLASNTQDKFYANNAINGKLYIGQRIGKSDSARSVFDELAIYSEQKNNQEILADYQKVLDGKSLTTEDASTFLAHFDSNLKEEKSGKEISYGKIIKTTSSKISSYTQPTSASILLYVIANNKKELTNFSTNYANWIDKKSIQKLAVDDQGNPLIQPSGKKYFLTKLTRTMKYSDMTADLFPQDAANNETTGKPISGGTDSRSPFFILIAMSLAVTIILIIIITIKNQQKSTYKDNNIIIKGPFNRQGP